jgi:hypothetical protein
MPDPNTSSTPPVWPPAPEGMESSPTGTGDIREFEYQNGWFLFLLLIVTLGFYVPFWMMRISRTNNRIYPDNPVPLYLAQILLGTLAANIISAFVFDTLLAIHITLSGPIVTVSNVFGFGIDIYALVLYFVYRNALNRAIERTSPKLHYIGGIGTFFFGVLFLQIRLNQRIRQSQLQVQQESPMDTPRT